MKFFLLLSIIKEQIFRVFSCCCGKILKNKIWKTTMEFSFNLKWKIIMYKFENYHAKKHNNFQCNFQMEKQGKFLNK